MTDPTHAFSRRRLLTGAMAATTTALALGLTGCGDSGESKAAASIPATGTDDGATITMWSRAPLEKQATNAVKAYNASHKNQVKLSLLPNDDVEGKVGAAVQTDSLPDILAGDVVRIPYWASRASSPTSPRTSTAWPTRPTSRPATSRPERSTARSTPSPSSPTSRSWCGTRTSTRRPV